MSDFADPWPEHPQCLACGGLATTSRFDAGLKKTVVEHLDGAPACHIDGGNPFVRHSDDSISFPIQTHAEFVNPGKAAEWARFVASREDRTVYYGFIRGHGGHRCFGRVKSEDVAVGVAENVAGQWTVRSARRRSAQ